MLIGILETGPVPEELIDAHGSYPGRFAKMLDGQGFDFQTWSVMQGDFPPSVDAADGYLITGSKHGAYEDHPWIPPLEQFIRDAAEVRRPVVGICFGHQIIAQAMGGKVEKFSGGWSIGPTDYTIRGRSETVHAYHQDQVVEVPEGAEIVGRSDFCEVAALYYPGRAYSVQPHPEFDDSYAADLIDLKAPGVVDPDRIDTARARLGTPLTHDSVAGDIARFLKEGHL